MDNQVLITGATSGIGWACAQHIVKQGHHSLVIITGRQKNKLDAACAQLQTSKHTKVLGIVLDQSSTGSINEACIAIKEQSTQLNKVISNVGVNSVHQYGPKKFHRCPQSIFKETFNTNILNNIYLLQLIIPTLIKQERSKIILIGSRAYQEGIRGQSPYNISKAALVGLRRSLDSEYQRNHLSCDLINPGVVNNHRTRALRSATTINEDQIISEEQLAELITSRLQVFQGEEINV